MEQLTDLQICKRIAEIEGVEVHEESSIITGFSLVRSDSFERYNPLTDDALCFQLMVKYKVKVVPEYDDTQNYTHCCMYKESGEKFYVGDEIPNRAIPLAIIEAHKES